MEERSVRGLAAALRGVDEAYPLAGSVELTDLQGRPLALAEAFRPMGDVPGAAVESDH